MSHRSIEYQSGRPDQANRSIGQVSGEPLTWAAKTPVTVTGAFAEALAAAKGVGRLVRLSVPSSASEGVRINFSSDAATDYFLLEPGGAEAFSTEDAINVRDNGGGLSPELHIAVGVKD